METIGAVIRVPNLRWGYLEVIDRILKDGVRTNPRGQKTIELLASTIVVDDPTDALPVGVGRGVNLKIAAVEACQLMAGTPAPHLVLAASPNFAQYAEKDQTFHGNYGARINSQMYAVKRKLEEDPQSRQAVATLWNPSLDNMLNKRDYPCTVSLQFVIRSNKLSMITYMRSNDVWLGLAYDAFQFTQLQLSLARALDIESGPYIHKTGSLHLYERNLDDVNSRLIHVDRNSPRPSELPTGIGLEPEAYRLEFRDRGIALLLGVELADETPSEEWYRAQLDELR